MLKQSIFPLMSTQWNYSGIRSQVEQTVSCKHMSRVTPITVETSCIYTFIFIICIHIRHSEKMCLLKELGVDDDLPLH
jgi:hypothetical protein